MLLPHLSYIYILQFLQSSGVGVLDKSKGFFSARGHGARDFARRACGVRGLGRVRDRMLSCITTAAFVNKPAHTTRCVTSPYYETQ